jgi:hypothetical protein
MCVTFIVAATTMFASAAENPQGIPADYKLLYSQDLSKPDASKDFQFTDADAWKLGKTDDGKPFLEQHKQSSYKPTHRSPFNFALVGNKKFGDCIIEFECMQTSKEYPHRDMIFVLGYQGPSQFYYVHISSAADDNANNVFIVKDAPRKNIAKETNKGNDWGTNAWKKVRIERKVADGTIRVFFDDMKKPIMVAEDRSFGAGWIGAGTFDDTCRIGKIQVWGTSAEDKMAPAFAK